MSELEVVLSDGDVIGVETFLIKRGYTKKKPKFKLLKQWASDNNIELDGLDEYEDVYVICYLIQRDFKSFRKWFENFNTIDKTILS